MGSRAGALFLKKIIDYSPAETDQDFPEIIFHNNSRIPDRTRAIIYNGRSPLEDLHRSIDLFNKNGVDVIALACITSYYYYEQVSAMAHAPVINPLLLIAESIREDHPGIKRVGILATTGTIGSGLFHKALENSGVEVVTLPPYEQEELFMRSVYGKDGFKSSRISAEAWELMHASLQSLVNLGVDLVIGGCTEVSIGIDPALMKVPFIDASDLLAKKTVEYCYNLHTEPVKVKIDG